jgi:hypothetical protein
MQPPYIMERTREKAQEAAEKTGEAISKGLRRVIEQNQMLRKRVEKRAFSRTQEDRKKQNIQKKAQKER